MFLITLPYFRPVRYDTKSVHITNFQCVIYFLEGPEKI